jgi:hypothetical protein
MASEVATLRNGATVEVGVIGHEGVADVNALQNIQCLVNNLDIRASI